jgi:hypothetical protein
MQTEHNFNTGELIEKLMKEDYFFKDILDIPMVSFTANETREYREVNSSKYRSRISRLFYEQTGKGISESTMKSIINTLNAYADTKDDVRETFLRIAGKNGKIFYDLANSLNEMIEISNNGVKVIGPNDEVIFNRFSHQKTQPYPQAGGKLSMIQKYVNICKDDALLFCVYIVSCFIPDLQHPICILHGEAGQGKTTVAKVISELVDPYKGELLKIPDKDDAFYAILDKHWLLPFDNISHITTKRSDEFCQTTTGITYPARVLFTTNDAKYITAKRCLVLNGIENCATRDDLLSRSLLFEIKRNAGQDSKPDNELFNDFMSEKPYLLGCIFDIIKRAMEIYPTVQIKGNYRMSGFIKWSFAIAEAIGGKGNEFIALYCKNKKKQEAEVIASNTLVSAVITLLEEAPNNEWHGRPSGLLHEIKRISLENGLNLRSDTMPDSAPLLTRKLNAYNNILLGVGITFTHNGHKNYGSKITLIKS